MFQDELLALIQLQLLYKFEDLIGQESEYLQESKTIQV